VFLMHGKAICWPRVSALSRIGLAGHDTSISAARFEAVLQNVQAEHPPDEEYSDCGHDNVADPLREGPGLSSVLHGSRMSSSWTTGSCPTAVLARIAGRCKAAYVERLDFTTLSPYGITHAPFFHSDKEMNLLLLIIVLLLLLGALPTWPYSSSWGYYPSGGLGLVLIILIVVLFVRR